MRIKSFFKKSVFFLLISVLFAFLYSCSVDSGSSNGSESADTQYGSLTINNSGNSDEAARALDTSSITKADVTVSGYGMTAKSASDVSITSGSGSATISGIPVGKNRIVTVEAKSNINNVLTKIAGVKMTAVTDIATGDNSVTVNWASTARGNVYAKLLDLQYDVSSLQTSTVDALIPSGVHSTLVDADAIAADIKAGSTKTPDSYKISSGSVKFTCSEAVSSNVSIMVSDPASSAITSVASGTNTITGVTPGTWKVYGVINGSSIVFQTSVTVTAGQTCDAGTITLKVPSPRLEDSNGKQISEYITGTTTVYLKAHTYDDETEPSGTVIYYTLDGSTPTTSSTKYTSSGISVTTGKNLKAIAVCSGLIDSSVSSWTFAQPTLGSQHPSSGNYSVATTNTSAATGATISGSTTSFVLYSANATKVLLEIYSKAYGDADPLYDYWMTKDSNNYWRVTVNGDLKNAIYAFRCWGPNWTYSDSWTRGGSSAGFVSDVDSSGNRFNPNKVLFDPYAKELTHDKSDPNVLGSKTSAIYTSGATNRNTDTAAYATKGYVISDSTGYGTKPQIPAAEARVYESHLRGLTKHPSSSSLSTILSGMDGFSGVENVPEAYRGTYKGAAYMAKYLKALGVNTIELLPVHESDNDNIDSENSKISTKTQDGKTINYNEGNYWGYMTYGYFAPDRRFSYDKTAGGPTKEFKEMVKAFHDEGMEVYLDVVYNHSGEGGPWNGTTDSYQQAELTFMRGIDNQTYYCINSDGKSYWESSGCGNNLQCDNSVVRQLILDSLTYWLSDMGVDGFRFDLAPVLGRVGSNHDWSTFSSSADTLVKIGNLGKSNNVEMIAEAWDCSWPSGYNVGKFPDGWGDWNGVYRDVIRDFVGAHGYTITKSGTGVNYTMSASDAIWGHNGNGGTSSSSSTAKFGVQVNMIDAHDGFTLADLASYPINARENNPNIAWPFGPSDGGNSDMNYVPGSDAASYRRTARNYIALQMFTRGIPMIVWGDEFGRTQNGNNNAYDIDSVGTWNNYNMINTSSPQSVSTGGSGSYINKFGTFGNSSNVNGNFVFMKRMLKMHSDPAFTQSTTTAATTTWITGGSVSDYYFGFTTDGSSLTGGHKFAMITNQSSSEKSLTIPAPSSGYHWVRIADTGAWAETYENSWDPNDTTAAGYYTLTAATSYGVGAYSTVIFEQIKDGGETQTCEAPSISGTTPFTTSTTVSISCGTSGASVYYTTDGTTPSATNGTLYSSSFTVSKTTTVQAIAVKSGYTNSSVTSKKFSLDVPTVADPVISGTTPFTTSTTVTITCGTSGAAVYYTTDGTVPSASNGTKYTGAFTLTAKTTVKAIGILSGYESSGVVSKTFTLQTVSSKSGVMLQGFTWNSAPRGTSYNKQNPSPYWYKWYGIMKNRASDIKDTFAYVWFNPPSICDSSSSEGYAPTQLNDLNSYYGTADELKEVISAISPAKAIADIVINHRAGSTSWGDFTNPSWCDDYYAICSDDEGFSDSSSPMYGSTKKGAADTGASYGAYRDLDHTNTSVQNGIIAWMNDVLKPAGFVGWRYDYVKGYGGKYVGQYNAGSSTEFSVGEYWPTASYDASNPSAWGNEIKNWISATDSYNSGSTDRSKAFDFALKGAMNNVFGCTWRSGDYPNYYDGGSSATNNYALLADSSNLYISQPSDAVTFVDNHDTGSNQGHWQLNKDNLGIAYALILTHPGVPCVSWSHYFTYAEGGNGDTTYPYSGLSAASSYLAGNTVSGTSNTLRQHIDYLIQLRKNMGIEYDSVRTTLNATSSNYTAEITGTNGSVIVEIGSGYSVSDSEYTLAYSGTNFAIWTKGGSGTSKCKTPVITISGGKATITCGTSGATIHYGFSSSAMTSTYASAVTMTEGQTIYAYASLDGYEDSSVASKTYSSTTTYTITGCPSWWGDGSCVQFVWIYGGGVTTDKWVSGTYNATSSTVTFESDESPATCITVRFPSGTTAGDWSASYYNKSGNLTISGTSAAYSE